VKALGIAGQMHGATLLDSNIASCVRRFYGMMAAARRVRAAGRNVSASRQITGNLMMPGFTAPKLLWVQRHEPEIFRRWRKSCCRKIICVCA
jgi:xylulokinase